MFNAGFEREVSISRNSFFGWSLAGTTLGLGLLAGAAFVAYEIITNHLSMGAIKILIPLCFSGSMLTGISGIGLAITGTDKVIDIYHSKMGKKEDQAGKTASLGSVEAWNKEHYIGESQGNRFITNGEL